TGFDHWPCITHCPRSARYRGLTFGSVLRASASRAVGALLCQTISPVILFTARKLGASGCGTLMCPSSTPLPVTTNTKPPTTSGEQVARLWGQTFNLPNISRRQITPASTLSVQLGCVGLVLLGLKP